MERDALEQEGGAFQVYMECRQLPERWADLLLLEREGTAPFQFAEDATAERDLAHEVAAHTDNAMLPVVDDHIAGHATEDARLTRWRMEVRSWRKVQESGGFGCAGLGPNKSNWQKLEQVVDLLIVVIALGDLFSLGPPVMQEVLDEITLLRSGEPLPVPLKDALDIALTCACYPLENLLPRLADLFQVNPLGVVVSVRCVFSVDDLLNDLLRALSVRNGEREQDCAYPEKTRFFLDHLLPLPIEKIRRFDA